MQTFATIMRLRALSGERRLQPHHREHCSEASGKANERNFSAIMVSEQAAILASAVMTNGIYSTRLIVFARRATAGIGQLDGDVSIQLGGYFDGGQLDPGSTEMAVSRGYAL